MKITKVEVFRLPTANSKQNSPIGCRIHTDVGICGDGEAGMAYGVGGSGAFGMVSLTPVAQAFWFHLPQIFYFGVPKYNGSAIVTMMLVSLTTMIESTGVYFALSDVTGQKITEDDMKRGYRAEGIAAILGGIFNTFPYSTF